MRRSPVNHVVLAWAASLIVHGGVAAALLQYYPPPETRPDIAVMELVQLPVIVAPREPAPEPPQPVQPPARKPPLVAKPKRPEPVPEITERTEPAPPVETSAPPEPPAPVMQAMADVSPAPEPEPVVDLKAAYLENPRPAYPEVARRRGWEGTVVIHLMLDQEGLPSGLRVERSSGFEILDRVALESVQRWRFRPALSNGMAVAVPSVTIPIHFRITNK